MAKTHRRGRKHRRTRSRRHRGGAGAPITPSTPSPMMGSNMANPGTYNSASSYQLAVNGTGNEQFDRVFNDTSSQSNGITGLQGQRAGSRRRRHHRKRKGGMWGEIVSQAVVPLSLLAMQQRYGKGKKRSSRSRRH